MWNLVSKCNTKDHLSEGLIEVKLGIIYRSVTLYLYITFSLDAKLAQIFIGEFKKGKYAVHMLLL